MFMTNACLAYMRMCVECVYIYYIQWTVHIHAPMIQPFYPEPTERKGIEVVYLYSYDIQ